MAQHGDDRSLWSPYRPLPHWQADADLFTTGVRATCAPALRGTKRSSNAFHRLIQSQQRRPHDTASKRATRVREPLFLFQFSALRVTKNNGTASRQRPQPHCRVGQAVIVAVAVGLCLLSASPRPSLLSEISPTRRTYSTDNEFSDNPLLTKPSKVHVYVLT